MTDGQIKKLVDKIVEIVEDDDITPVVQEEIVEAVREAVRDL